MTDRYDEQNKTNTKMCWTEDNRMQAYVQMNEGTDKGRAAYYGYNTTGERYVRYIGTTINITQNGITFHRPVLQSPVLYANSHITINGKGYTKHYFEGDRRVCSKIGGGFTDRTEDDINDRIQPIEGEYDKLFERQYTGIKETFANCIGTEMEHNLKYDPYKTIMENELGRDEAEPAFYYQGDHLGSSAYLTDEAGAITQTLNYLPYGEDWVDVHNNPNYLSRYKYNGKEKDPESGLHYYGARYYDSDISQWLSIDPMADKYPSLSPYNYCADNPVNIIDPDGREGIVISGGEYDGDRYKYNFIEPAITRLKQLKEINANEPITWVVMTAGYSDRDISKFQSIAENLGVSFQLIGSADELTNYLNSKNIGVSDLSKARQDDQITSMSVFGHGFAGSAEFAYNQDNQACFSWSTNHVKRLDKRAFNNATIDLYTCNSATNTYNGTSLANDLSARTSSIVTGYRGQSTYRKINQGQGWGAKWNRARNGFNTNGSIKLPQAGDRATRIRYVPSKNE